MKISDSFASETVGAGLRTRCQNSHKGLGDGKR